MSFPEGGDIEPFDWFNRFFGSRRNRGWGRSFPDIFRNIDEMRRDMEAEVQDMIILVRLIIPNLKVWLNMVSLN